MPRQQCNIDFFGVYAVLHMRAGNYRTDLNNFWHAYTHRHRPKH